MAIDAVKLTQDLLRFNTTNPPGHEAPCIGFLAGVLEEGGFSVWIDHFAPGRANLVARLEGTVEDDPFVWSGHVDTVPLGQAPWSVSAFDGEIRDGRLYGRGASDMKSGVAAIVAAGLRLASEGGLKRGLTLLLSAGEEVGCVGARELVLKPERLGKASALLVAEPTSNRPAIGHKGAMYLHARTRGVTAHSAMPEKGDNAIYKAARAIAKVAEYRFSERHPVLGAPTINVGMVSGGMNVNSVPDAAAFTIDVRSVPGQTHDGVQTALAEYLGPEVELERFVDMPAVASDPEGEFLRLVYRLTGESQVFALPYFTDASVFQHFYSCPVLILGPGEAAMAHQTDEWCDVHRIEEGVGILLRLARAWDDR